MSEEQKADTPTPESVKAESEAFAAPRRKGELKAAPMTASNIPAPSIPNEDFGPQAFAAIPVFDEEGNPTSEFYLDETKAKWLHFTAPGAPIPSKPRYTIKAMHPDGRLVQLPFEEQINNTAAGDKEDAIGLNRYRRKGIHLFVNMDTLMPIYCPASDCWAAGSPKLAGFCSPQHANGTLPNRFDEAGEVLDGMMSRNVTTTRVWAG